MTAPSLADLGLSPGGAPEPSTESILTLPVRVRAWGWAHRHSAFVLAPLLVLVAVAHLWGISRGPAVTDDEGTYMAEAWAVQVPHHLSHYTYWYDHPPLGWIQIAGWTWLTGAYGPSTHAIVTGRYLMVVAALASAGLVYVLARRLQYRRSLAALAVLLFGLSPLAVDYQRMVLLDNLAVPWALAALVLAASPRRNLWAAAAAGVCMTVSVLSKETFLLLVPAVIVMLWVRGDRRTRAFCLTAFGATFALLLCAYPLLALLRGELVPGSGHVSLTQAIQFQLSGRQSSGSILSSTSLAHQTVSKWLAIDGWLLVLGVLALAGVTLSRRLWPVGVALMFPMLVSLRGGYLPDPFVIGLLPFAALSVAGAVDAGAGLLSRRTPPRWQLAATVTAVVVSAVAVAPSWAHGDQRLADQNITQPVWAAESWVETNVPRHDRIIVDDSLWVDLVEHGFSADLGVVWFYKLDTTNNLDPSVQRSLPDGYRDFAYIISTPVIRSALAQDPSGYLPVRAALAHSVPVATFGPGTAQVQVRRISLPLPAATDVRPDPEHKTAQ